MQTGEMLDRVERLLDFGSNPEEHIGEWCSIRLSRSRSEVSSLIRSKYGAVREGQPVYRSANPH